MGNKNAKITVTFDQSIFFTNECVTGNVHLDIGGGNEVSDVNLIYVVIKGLVAPKPKKKNDRPWAIFESTKSILASPQPPESNITFKQGHYSWPFFIPLKEYLPPPFATRTEDLNYYIEVTFEKAWFRSNLAYSQRVMICPHVNLQQTSNASFSFSDNKQEGNNIKISGTLNKYGFTAGEKIKCKLEIFNTKRLLIKNIVTSMFCTCTVRAGLPSVHIFQSNNDVKTILEQTTTPINNTRDEMISELIEIELPSVYFPPTYNFACEIKGFLGTGTCNINISYTLKIDLKVESILTNISVSVPITIGTIPHLVGQDDQLPRITYPNPTDATNICDDRDIY